MMNLKTVLFLNNHKAVKKSSAADMLRNKLHSHTQFSADFYKISTKKSEKNHILWIQPVLVKIQNFVCFMAMSINNLFFRRFLMKTSIYFFQFSIHLTSILCQLGLSDDQIQLTHNSMFVLKGFCMTEFRRIR